MAAKTKRRSRRRKGIRKVSRAIIHVLATFNNTLITVTDLRGNVVATSSTGEVGFKGSRKSTPFAATTAMEKVAKKMKNQLMVKEAKVYIKGPGTGRDAALRVLRNSGIKITMIADVTPIPHNGCRSRKPRRG